MNKFSMNLLLFQNLTPVSVEYLSTPAGAQNVSCLGFCSRDICSINLVLYGPGILSNFSC